MAHPMIGKWHSHLIRDDGAILDDGEFNFTDIDDNDAGKVNTAQHTLGGSSKPVTGNVKRINDGFRFALRHEDFGSTGTTFRNYGGTLVMNGPIVGGQPIFSMVVGRMNKDGSALQKTKSKKAVAFADQLDGTVVITRP